MYKYTAYGHKILSDIAFEQFEKAEFDSEGDIRIHHYVEKEIKDILQEDYQVSIRNKDIFYRNQVGFFEARNGKEIFFEEYPGCSLTEAKEFVMGNTFALLFYEKDMNVIHGAAVRIGDKTIIVSGDSGAGKSTVTSKLIREGARLITDDQSVIYVKDNVPMLLPGYPAQKLCVDAADRNDLNIDNLVKVDDQKNKYAVSRKENFYSEVSKVDAVIFLQKHKEGEEVIAKKIGGAEKVNMFTRYLFLFPFFQTAVMLPTDLMLQCVRISSLIDIYTVSRKENVNTESKIYSFIENQIL
ncbi:MAG: hypothetical protein K6A23_04120 [Butyrivibrio sp.]|nr:hypothetical protein [Butyrivibrio sp.]